MFEPAKRLGVFDEMSDAQITYDQIVFEPAKRLGVFDSMNQMDATNPAQSV